MKKLCKLLISYNAEHMYDKIPKFLKVRYLPFNVQTEVIKYCPYAEHQIGVIKCKVDNKDYGCNPTALCTFLLKRDSENTNTL